MELPGSLSQGEFLGQDGDSVVGLLKESLRGLASNVSGVDSLEVFRHQGQESWRDKGRRGLLPVRTGFPWGPAPLRPQASEPSPSLCPDCGLALPSLSASSSVGLLGCPTPGPRAFLLLVASTNEGTQPPSVWLRDVPHLLGYD